MSENDLASKHETEDLEMPVELGDLCACLHCNEPCFNQKAATASD